MRRWICGVLAGFLLLPVLGLPVWAQEATGTLHVMVDSGFVDVMGKRLRLYKVGERSEEGFRIAEEFGGGIVLWRDAFSPHLAQLLAQTEGSAGYFQTMDMDNSAAFSHLPQGLYLLTEEEGVILPCLVAMPTDGQWYVQAYPAVRQPDLENPATGQHPGPILGAIGMVVSGIGLALCAGRMRKKD